MIIYGWNSKSLKQAPLENFECPSCKEKNSVLLITAHYVHVFWIPLFPYKKAADIVCPSCQFVLREKEVGEDKKQLVRQLKKAVPTPKYLFVGLLAIVLGVSYLVGNSIIEDSQAQTYVENPQVGDVYLIKDPQEPSEYNHYLLKVNDVTEDSLWVSFSSYSYNGIVSSLDPKDGFYDIMIPMHKNDIITLKNTDELKKVFRDYSESSGFDRVVAYQFPDSTQMSN